MRAVRSLVKRCARATGRLGGNRRGATAVEYGMIVALIVIAMIASFKEVANTTVGIWSNVNAKVGKATGY